MEGIYTSYVCTSCKRQLVLITEEIQSMAKGKYLACSYCGCRHIKKQSIGDSLKECMKESAYKRVHGAMRQVR